MATTQSYALRADIILRYLITADDATDTLITAKSSEINLVTTDFEIYRALACIRQEDAFNLNKLRKLFEAVAVMSYEHQTGKKKPILKEADVEATRALALGGNNGK